MASNAKKEDEIAISGQGSALKSEPQRTAKAQNEGKSKRHAASQTTAPNEDPDAKKRRLLTEDEAEVLLNPADCNLDFNVDDTGLGGHALFEKGFAYCWSGARATVGIRNGKYCFSCKVIDAQPVEMEDTPSGQQHLCRVGISRGDDDVGNLGETAHSFGFGGTGKFSTAGKFSDYGTTYSVGDTIVCCVNLESKPLAEISFLKNGRNLGTAQKFDVGPKGLQITEYSLRTRGWESALFPHVLLKNVVVKFQFSSEDGLTPPEGYKPWNAALSEGNAVLGPQSNKKNECEVLMMVGLPAAGKSTWAENWAKEHPEKRYLILGTNLALDQMKVPGLLRKHNYGERFDRLMDRATGIFNTLLERATKTPRNYILDQTNVYKSARKRKLRPFVDFWKIAVCIFPPAEELKIRAKERFKEMGKEVPADAVNEMLANYTLPMSKDMFRSDELFDEVWFPELNRADAQRVLETEKSVLKAKTITKSQDISRECSVGSVTGPRCFASEESPVPSAIWRGGDAVHPGYHAYNLKWDASGDMSLYSRANSVSSAANSGLPNIYSRGDSVGSIVGSRMLDQRDFPVEARNWQASNDTSGHAYASVSLYGRNDPRNPMTYDNPSSDYQTSVRSGLAGSYDYPSNQYGGDVSYRDTRAPYHYPSNYYERDVSYRDTRAPCPAANTGSYRMPPSYGMSEPGSLQPPQSLPPGSYSMGPPRPSWGYSRY